MSEGCQMYRCQEDARQTSVLTVLHHQFTWPFLPCYSWTSWRRQQMQLTLSSWQTLSTWRYSRTLRTTRPHQGRSAWLTGRPSSTWWVWAEEVSRLSVRQSGQKRFRRPRAHRLWKGRFLPSSVLQTSKIKSPFQCSPLRRGSSCFFKALCSLFSGYIPNSVPLFREPWGHPWLWTCTSRQLWWMPPWALMYRSWLIHVSFELGYPSDYAGESAVWQAESESDSFFHLPKVKAQHKYQGHPQHSDFIRHKEAGVAIWCN